MDVGMDLALTDTLSGAFLALDKPLMQYIICMQDISYI